MGTSFGLEEFFDDAAATRAAFPMLGSSVLKKSFKRAGALAMVRLITIKKAPNI